MTTHGYILVSIVAYIHIPKWTLIFETVFIILVGWSLHNEPAHFPLPRRRVTTSYSFTVHYLLYTLNFSGVLSDPVDPVYISGHDRRVADNEKGDGLDIEHCTLKVGLFPRRGDQNHSRWSGETHETFWMNSKRQLTMLFKTSLITVFVRRTHLRFRGRHVPRCRLSLYSSTSEYSLFCGRSPNAEGVYCIWVKLILTHQWIKWIEDRLCVDEDWRGDRRTFSTHSFGWRGFFLMRLNQVLLPSMSSFLRVRSALLEIGEAS